MIITWSHARTNNDTNMSLQLMYFYCRFIEQLALSLKSRFRNWRKTYVTSPVSSTEWGKAGVMNSYSSHDNLHYRYLEVRMKSRNHVIVTNLLQLHCEIKLSHDYTLKSSYLSHLHGEITLESQNHTQYIPSVASTVWPNTRVTEPHSGHPICRVYRVRLHWSHKITLKPSRLPPIRSSVIWQAYIAQNLQTNQLVIGS